MQSLSKTSSVESSFLAGLVNLLALLSWLLVTVTGGGVLWKVVPSWAAMAAGLGVELPAISRIVVAASNWFVRLVIPAVLLGLFVTPLVILCLVFLARRRPYLPAVLFLLATILSSLLLALTLYAMYSPLIEEIHRLS